MKTTSRQKKDRLLKYLLYVSILALGVAAGIAIRHYYQIPMIEAINIVDVATLIVTIFLAVYIPGVFDRQLQVKQDKKELIEHRLEELQGFYRRVNQIAQNGAETDRDVYIVNNTLDVAANRLTIISTLMEYLNLDDTFKEEMEELKGLNREYELLLNGTEQPKDGFIYPETIRRKEEQLYNKLDKATSLLVFKISDI